MSFAASPIPQDIIDTIIDMVAMSQSHKNRESNMKTLSIVSRSFLPRSQKHIFDTIVLQCADLASMAVLPTNPRGNTVVSLGRRLLELLEGSPHLFKYVRSLTMRACYPEEIYWIQSDESSALLRSCRRLQTLQYGREVEHSLLIEPESEDPDIIWDDIGQSMQSSLLLLIQSSQLQNLVLTGIESLPVSLIGDFGALTSLQLVKTCFASESSSESETRMKLVELSRPRLEKLSVAIDLSSLRILIGLDKHFSQMSSALDLSQAEFLDIDAFHSRPRESSVKFTDIIDSTVLKNIRHLRDLHVAFWSLDISQHAFPEPSLLDSLKNLRRISFAVSMSNQALRQACSFAQKVIAITASVKDIIIMFPVSSATIESLDALLIWEDFELPTSIEQLSFIFFLPEIDGPEGFPYISVTDDFLLKLPSIVKGNLHRLTKQKRVHLLYQIIQSDEIDEVRIQAEIRSTRRFIIAEPQHRHLFSAWSPTS